MNRCARDRRKQRISEEDGPVDPQQLEGEAGLSQGKLTSALQRLEDAGVAKTLPSGKVRSRPSSDVRKAAQAAAQADEKRRESRRQALEKMREYAETSGCRRELLLRYLGDNFSGPCNHCDNCDAVSGSAAPTTAAMP